MRCVEEFQRLQMVNDAEIKSYHLVLNNQFRMDQHN